MAQESKQSQKKNNGTIERPPVVVIMGHIDHGKSKLLDSIRKTNIVENEAGGITQHLSAYEVVYKEQSGKNKKITFLDTPGHEAFQKMRCRGAEVADIAVLIVAADEGVKAQTIEAYTSIKECGIPFVVAINKIDKAEADIEKTKNNLLENEIYLEGLGGEIPWVAISAKNNTGIDELLEMILLVAELEELRGDPNISAEGIVIEAHRDTKKGIAATLIIKNGTLKNGMYVAAGGSLSPVRIMEDFQGNVIREASFSTPVKIIGFNTIPSIEAHFESFDTKKEAERANTKQTPTKKDVENVDEINEEKIIFPIILKADVSGSLDAIEHELQKLQNDDINIKIIQKTVGTISENDIKIASGNVDTAVLGFNTVIDSHAQDTANRLNITIKTFDIIYKLSEWVEEEIKKRTPEKEVDEILGKAKILKIFGKTKNKQIVGGRVLEGELSLKSKIKIMRKDVEIGKGVIAGLQQQKVEVEKVSEENEFGMQIESKIEIVAGDMLENFVTVKK